MNEHKVFKEIKTFERFKTSDHVEPYEPFERAATWQELAFRT
jgi:hypothetical protein